MPVLSHIHLSCGGLQNATEQSIDAISCLGIGVLAFDRVEMAFSPSFIFMHA